MPQKMQRAMPDPHRLPVDLEPIPLAGDEPVSNPASFEEAVETRIPLEARAAGWLLTFFTEFLTPFSGPYRVLAYKLNTFPNLCGGTLILIGMIFVYPMFNLAFTDFESIERLKVAITGILILWAAMLIAAWVQGWARWSIELPRRDQAVSQSWAGKREPVLVAATCLLGWVFCGRGFALFVLTGYLASTMQIWLIRLKRRLKAWSAEDSKRLLSPVRTAASTTGGKVRTVAVSAGAAAMPVMGLLKGVFRRPAAEGGTTPTLTFWGWVARHLVSLSIFNLVTGGITIGAIFSGFGFLIAIPLWLLGWKVEPPEEDRQRGRDFAKGVSEAFQDEQDGWKVPFRGQVEGGSSRSGWDSVKEDPFGFEQGGFQ